MCHVGFETLTSSLGQVLVLQKAEDFVGQKTAFIVENNSISKTPIIEQNRLTFVQFIKKDLGFIDEEIIHLSVPDLLCKYNQEFLTYL